jgi:hypothetical protein
LGFFIQLFASQSGPKHEERAQFLLQNCARFWNKCDDVLKLLDCCSTFFGNEQVIYLIKAFFKPLFIDINTSVIL